MEQATMFDAKPRSGAILSGCGRFRFLLWRAWGDQDEEGKPERYANFVMLNPSTADAQKDDPTIRRCMGFARSWGLDGIVVTNAYPLRATDPRELLRTPDRCGPSAPADNNDHHVLHAAEHADVVVCAWGVNIETPRHHHTMGVIRQSGARPHCLARSAEGLPCHPLYLPSRLTPIEYAG